MTQPAPPAFQMIDIARKRVTNRRALASGRIHVGRKVFDLIADKALPKGDALSLAEIAGITGAKKTPEILAMCHPLPLDKVEITCVPEAPDVIAVYGQAAACAKTGVEMEALMAVNAALMTIWDLSKGTEPALEIYDIRLLVKQGGKSGLWQNPDGIPDWLSKTLPRPVDLSAKSAAILVMSDRAAQGGYEDKSGPVLTRALEGLGADILATEIIPDDVQTIRERLVKMCDEMRPDVILTSGGTGPGPRDVTPEVLEDVCDRMLHGLGEVMRRESAAFTDTAWLSRMNAGMRGASLIISLPGSPKAVGECLEILHPVLGHALNMIAGQGHKKA